MGNACCGAPKTTIPEPRIPPIKKTVGNTNTNSDEELIVFGDYFQSETRTILAILEFAECKYSFKPIDSFQGENEKDDFLKINPLGQIPTIKDKSTLVLGNLSTQIEYVIKCFYITN